VSIVLDAWAVVELLRERPAARRVAAAIMANDCAMSSINLGEVHYAIVRSHGRRVARDRVGDVRSVVRVEDPDWEMVEAAAEIKARGGLSYPDAFCVATALRHRAPLYTGDPEIIKLDLDVEVIDLRSTT
jgi:predicted nucleic acid-binding protein